MRPPVRPIEWLGDRVRIIDQRCLPLKECCLDLKSAEEVAASIKIMALRGAPLIGIAAAMGVAVEALRWQRWSRSEFDIHLNSAIQLLRATRPTASNLFWALERMLRVLQRCSPGSSCQACSEALTQEALTIYNEDLETGYSMGQIGKELLEPGCTVLTHCNAGGLATSGYGTALAPLYVAHQEGVPFKVFADETRPLLQGARLTAWELARAGIDVTLICDSACHLLMARGRVDLVLVGADRITAGGDFANKIGTYGVARSADAHRIPFYVVAPTSTIDFGLVRGEDIPIEERDPLEVLQVMGMTVAPAHVPAYNPAFDVTPARLVTGIITERGLVRPPYPENLARLKPSESQKR